jgi:hypothetical protein
MMFEMEPDPLFYNKIDHNQKEPQPPPMHKRMINFAKAAANHAAHGHPQCSQQEIEYRFNMCQSCEFFKQKDEAGICTHIKCGCNINKKQIYLNKLAWADQECPIGKWGKIDKNGV